MLIRDLDFLRSNPQSASLRGAAYTSATADAHAAKHIATADADAMANGDYASVKTRTKVSSSAGRFISSSKAVATAKAFAKSGSQYSVSYDYDIDYDIDYGIDYA